MSKKNNSQSVYKLSILFLLVLSLIIFDNFTNHIYSQKFIGKTWKDLSAAVVRLTLTITPSIDDNLSSSSFWPQSGGEMAFVSADNNYKFNIGLPAGVINNSRSMSVFINRKEENTLESIQRLPRATYKIVGDAIYDITARLDTGEAITKFDKPITLTFTYTDDQVKDKDEKNLRVYYWDTEKNDWAIIENSVIDTVNKTVFVTADHLTLFTIMGPPKATSAVSSGSSGGGSLDGGSLISIAPATEGKFGFSTPQNARVNVFFPAGAIRSLKPVSALIIPINKVSFSSTHPLPANYRIVGDAIYDITARLDTGEAITKFDKPITLTFTYTDDQVKDKDEKNLRVYYWDTAKNDWMGMDNGLVDTVNKTVLVTTTHFTLFTLLAPPKTTIVYTADLNGDKKVNLIDFSILLFNWGTPSNKKADINQSGRVDLADFAIMLYQWTG